MNPQKIGVALLGVFGVGIFLIAAGLGFNTRLAALGVGIVLCFASISFLSGGPRT
jgi:uncharacterized membrane protein YccC